MEKKQPFPIFINRTKYEVTDEVQAGAQLKTLAGVPLTDTLFKDRPHEDEVITNEMQVSLKPGDQFHSAPPADYGRSEEPHDPAHRMERLSQPNGWTFVVMHDYKLPDCYKPDVVKLLLKLPPQFPDAAPDMLWIFPHITVNGAAPKGTSPELLLGDTWMRFSWHLKPGAWRLGVSELRDYLRTVRDRFERRD